MTKLNKTTQRERMCQIYDLISGDNTDLRKLGRFTVTNYQEGKDIIFLNTAGSFMEDLALDLGFSSYIGRQNHVLLYGMR